MLVKISVSYICASHYELHGKSKAVTEYKVALVQARMLHLLDLSLRREEISTEELKSELREKRVLIGDKWVYIWKELFSPEKQNILERL